MSTIHLKSPYAEFLGSAQELIFIRNSTNEDRPYGAGHKLVEFEDGTQRFLPVDWFVGYDAPEPEQPPASEPPPDESD